MLLRDLIRTVFTTSCLPHSGLRDGGSLNKVPYRYSYEKATILRLRGHDTVPVRSTERFFRVQALVCLADSGWRIAVRLLG